jgi:AraC family transcriptional regulator
MHLDPDRSAHRPMRRTALAPWQERTVSTYIEVHLQAPIRNADLAALARLSQSHFNHAFRNSFGHAPREYIIHRRMVRAQGLMLSTESPLCEIAAACGLADQAHFSRLFRKVFGDSPAAWRRARFEPATRRTSGSRLEGSNA